MLQSRHFRPGEELQTTLHRHVRLYNQQLPQSALGSSPLHVMKDWHKMKAELFRKQPYYLPGCDTQAEKQLDVWESEIKMLNARIFISLVPIFIGVFNSASASTEMDCGGIGYRYVDNFFSVDEVKWLLPESVDWGDYCSDSKSPNVRTSADFPLVVCEYTSKYEFKVSPSKFSDAGTSLTLLWRKDEGDVKFWQEYLFTLGEVPGEIVYAESEKSVPFDVVKIFHRFKDIHAGELSWSWTTSSKSIYRLNFETRRTQHEALSVSTSGLATFKIEGSKETYNCSK